MVMSLAFGECGPTNSLNCRAGTCYLWPEKHGKTKFITQNMNLNLWKMLFQEASKQASE